MPQSDVPGEKTSPTQPFPTKPPAYTRTVLHVPDDLVDFTPALREQALKQIARYKVGPSMYNPAVLGSVNGLLGAINMGNAVGHCTCFFKNNNPHGYSFQTLDL